MGYAYNVAGEVSCIAYPLSDGGSSNCSQSASNTSNFIVTRGYDAVGRLASVTDWNSKTTSFGGYNQVSELGQITYPSAPSVTAMTMSET